MTAWADRSWLHSLPKPCRHSGARDGTLISQELWMHHPCIGASTGSGNEQRASIPLVAQYRFAKDLRSCLQLSMMSRYPLADLSDRTFHVGQEPQRPGGGCQRKHRLLSSSSASQAQGRRLPRLGQPSAAIAGWRRHRRELVTRVGETHFRQWRTAGCMASFLLARLREYPNYGKRSREASRRRICECSRSQLVPAEQSRGGSALTKRPTSRRNNYVPHEPGSPALLNALREIKRQLLHSHEPWAHHLDLMGLSSLRLPSRPTKGGASSPNLFGRMAEIQPTGQRNLQTSDRKTKPTPLDLRNNTMIDELPFKSPVTKSWSRPGQGVQLQLLRPTVAPSPQRHHQRTSTQETKRGENFSSPCKTGSRHRPFPMAANSPAHKEEHEGVDYLAFWISSRKLTTVHLEKGIRLFQ
uniref:Uncharacterized protein n=1 Tax=Sphaerodactylus townsendi TaxID=933632 RepID=A0ACB8FG50_9SAUR